MYTNFVYVQNGQLRTEIYLEGEGRAGEKQEGEKWEREKVH